MARKKTYVLDTSVYLTDFNSIYAFKNNDIVVPLKVLEEYEGWRKVEDFNQNIGWIHKSLISGIRTGIVLSNDNKNIKLNKTLRFIFIPETIVMFLKGLKTNSKFKRL